MLQENEWERTERRWNQEETSWGEKSGIVNKGVIVKHWYVVSYMMSYHTCYDVMGHGVWRHRHVAGTQAKFRTYSYLINYRNGYDIIYEEVVTWPMTSHTMCYDIICNGHMQWIHTNFICNGFTRIFELLIAEVYFRPFCLNFKACCGKRSWKMWEPPV